ncbi:MAG: DUF4089 domain-containing protein, partial [Candidatus Competibacteraceae bacterium]
MTPEFLPPPADFDGETYLNAVAPALGLSIDPAYRPGLLMYLDFTARMAQFVMDFELPDNLEPAPVFRP